VAVRMLDMLVTDLANDASEFGNCPAPMMNEGGRGRSTLVDGVQVPESWLPDGCHEGRM